MKKKRNLYIVAFLCFITLVGVTIAYLQSTNTFENIFNAGTYKTVTHEEFISPTNWTPGDETPKTITTKNEGTIPVRVRVKFDEEWTSKNGDPLELTYNGENAAIINLDNINDWILKDGYYYYTKELAPGETTSSLIKSVTFNPNIAGDVNCTTENGTVTCESSGNSYDGATYKLKIITETVQAKNYEEIWENVPIIYDYVGDNPCIYEGELVPGAEYVNGQYTYRYRQEKSNSDWIDITDNGWGVILTDKASTDPVTTTLCSSINNKPIVSTRRMFDGSKANMIDANSFDTSNVTNMEFMFALSAVTNLDLNSFNTSKVTNMHSMFSKCAATSIDLNNFNTSKVTDMNNMFFLSEALSLDLSSFDTSNVNDMSRMFWSSKAETINVSSFNTSNVTDMSWMFCNSHDRTLNLSNFDTSNVSNMSRMFQSYKSDELNISGFDTRNVTNMSLMFYGYESSTMILDLSNFDTRNVTNMNRMFCNTNITNYNLLSFNTSKVEDLQFMFGGCQATSLDLSSFDTSNATDTTRMFYNAVTTTGYARTQADADIFNATSDKPDTLTFVVKES